MVDEMGIIFWHLNLALFVKTWTNTRGKNARGLHFSRNGDKNENWKYISIFETNGSWLKGKLEINFSNGQREQMVKLLFKGY